MPQNIMIAGCAKDDRERVERTVRSAFGDRPEAEDWTVSLVFVANQWSIDIDGPEPQYKGLTLQVPADELTEGLQKMLAGAPSAGTAATPTPANGDAPVQAPQGAGGMRRERHTCEECAAGFEVVFEAAAGEPDELCPVACPACWHVNKVPIAEGAGATGDYRAESVA